MSTGLSRLKRELSGAATSGERPRAWVEPGEVYAVLTGYGDPQPAIRWRGQVVPCSYLAGYSPVVGDAVLLLIQDPAPPICLGKIIGPAEEES